MQNVLDSSDGSPTLPPLYKRVIRLADENVSRSSRQPSCNNECASTSVPVGRGHSSTSTAPHCLPPCKVRGTAPVPRTFSRVWSSAREVRQQCGPLLACSSCQRDAHEAACASIFRGPHRSLYLSLSSAYFSVAIRTLTAEPMNFLFSATWTSILSTDEVSSPPCAFSNILVTESWRVAHSTGINYTHPERISSP